MSRRLKDTRDYECLIRMLDDSEPLRVNVKVTSHSIPRGDDFRGEKFPGRFRIRKETPGRWLIEHVCFQLNIVEKDYFGLRYADADGQRQWLDLVKPITRQLKFASPMVLCFRVKFYPSSYDCMREEISRYYLFLQLRRDLLHGRLYCPNQSDACMLAGCIIQSEIGDYEQNELPEDYVSHFKIFPRPISIEMAAKISKAHASLTGQVPADAERSFLTRAATLETYGLDPYPIKRDASQFGLETRISVQDIEYFDKKPSPRDASPNAQLYVGATHQGVVVFQNSRRIHLFKWETVGKVGYEGKMFIINVYIREGGNQKVEDRFLLFVNRWRNHRRSLQPVPVHRKRVCGFKCLTFSECKALWKYVVEQRTFFTVPSSSNCSKLSSRIGLFSRASKFRYSGRVLNEVLADTSNVRRESPSFTRSVSNPQFVRPESVQSAASLPAGSIAAAAFLNAFHSNSKKIDLAPLKARQEAGMTEVEAHVPRTIVEADEDGDDAHFRPIESGMPVGYISSKQVSRNQTVSRPQPKAAAEMTVDKELDEGSRSRFQAELNTARGLPPDSLALDENQNLTSSTPQHSPARSVKYAPAQTPEEANSLNPSAAPDASQTQEITLVRSGGEVLVKSDEESAVSVALKQMFGFLIMVFFLLLLCSHLNILQFGFLHRFTDKVYIPMRRIFGKRT